MIRRVFLILAAPALIVAALTWSMAADKPAAPAESPPLVKTEPGLIDRLSKRVDFSGADDPQTTVQDVLDKIAKDTGLVFDVNEAAFRNEQIDNVLAKTIDKPLPKMKQVSGERLLRKLLSRIPVPSGATFMVRREAIEITTGAAQAAEVWPKGYEGPRLPLVHVVFDKKPLNEALKELARQSGMNVVLDIRAGDKAKLPVTAHFVNTPLDTAVRLLADMAEMTPYAVDNLYFVTTRENADRLAQRPRTPAAETDEMDGLPPGPYRVGWGPGSRPLPQPGGM